MSGQRSASASGRSALGHRTARLASEAVSRRLEHAGLASAAALRSLEHARMFATLARAWAGCWCCTGARLRTVGLAVACMLIASSALAAPLPRVVSINPCIDAVLVRVARPEQILALSHYSQDPQATSIPLNIAQKFRVTSGTAEEVVALAPDLVMSGPHVSPSTIFALERLNIRIVKFSVAESVAQSEQQIRDVAAAVGARERGEEIVAAIERAIAASRPHDERRLAAVIWQNGGMVPGKGSLADELLRLTGYRNFSAEYGLAKWDVLPLEYLIAKPPDVVLSIATADVEGDRMLGHPAVRVLAQRVPFRAYPFRLLQCGGPTIIEAVQRLAQVRDEVKGEVETRQ